MKALTDFIFITHIIAGTASLLLFWIPVFARKRKGLHTQVGLWYVYLMWIVVITAGILSIKNLVIGNLNQALFLGFLTVITSNPLWFAISIMKSKKEYTSGFINRFLILHISIVLFGLTLLIYGIFFVESTLKYLMIFFGVLGTLDIRELIRVNRMRTEKPDWYKQHYSGMITTGIAAYTAFFAFGGRIYLERILINEWQIIPWILPTIIGIITIRLLDHRRSRRLA